MDTTIEKLQFESNEIRVALESLQKQAQNAETEKKKQELVAQAEEAKKQAETLLQTEIDENTKAQLEEIKKQLENYTSELQALRTEVKEQTQPEKQQETIDSTDQTSSAASPSSAPEKEKNFLQKGIDWIKGDEKETHHTAKTIGRGALVASGIGIGVYGLGKLFGRWGKKEEKADSSEGKEEKPKKTFRWKKALGWGAGILGGTWLGRGLLTGNWDFFGRNPFSKEKKDGPETVPSFGLDKSVKSYEHLKEEEKQPFESSASAINEYLGNIMGDSTGAEQVEDMLGDSAFDQGKEGLVPYILSNRYANLGKMLGETAFYYEILGLEGHLLWDKMKDWTLDQLKTFVLLPLAGVVDTATFKLLNAASNTGEFIENLKTIPNAEQTMRTVFRKSISVMSYYQSRKRALEYQLAEQELLKSDPNFAKLSEEEKSEKITDQLDNDERYQKHIQPEVETFMGKSLKNATLYLQERNLLNGEVDVLVKKSVDKLEERRKEILDIDDEDDISSLEYMKPEISNGKLPEKSQKKLEKICEDFEEEMEGFGRKSWRNKYLPILEMFDLDEDTLSKILASGGYEDAIGPYKEVLNTIREKNKNGTLKAEDLAMLETTINDYYKFQKALMSEGINLSESRDEHGNAVLRWVDKVYCNGQELVREIKIGIKGDIRDKIKARGKVALLGASLDILTYPIRLANGALHGRVAKSPTVKVLYRGVIKPSANFGAHAVARLTGNTIRAHLPGVVSARFYTVDTFRMAVGRGEISLKRAAEIAKHKQFSFGAIASGNGTLVETPEHVIQYLFGSTPQEAKRVTAIVEQFGDNPKIYHQLFHESYQRAPGRWRKPQEIFKLNRSHIKFELKTSVLNKLEDIATRVNALPNTQKAVLQSVMKNIKNLDHAEDFAIMSVGDDMVKLLESGKVLSAEQYGKYLAKYAGKLDANDLRALENFMLQAHKADKVGTNPQLFIRNTFKNLKHLKANNFELQSIEKLKLTKGKRWHLAEQTKANTNKMLTSLQKMKANPKFKPFAKGIGNQISALQDYAKTITPEGMKAMQNFSIFSKESAFAKLSTEGMHELSRLSYMLRDMDLAKDLSQALKGAKTTNEVKVVLSGKGIAVHHIDDAVLMKIAKSGSVKNIKDIVNYGAEFEAIKGVQKLIKHPAMKYAGRMLGKGLVVADFLFVGYNFSTQLSEAQQIKQNNLERGEWKENQAYYELGTGGLGAVAGACMFIPGAGWVAAGVLAASIGAMEVGKKYFEDIEKFKQNKADFLAKGIAATKQELTSLDSRDQGLSRTWIDKLSALDSNWLLFNPITVSYGFLGKVGTDSVEKKKAGVPKTKAEALKALIRMEELQKNPLAAADLNDPEVLKNPELGEQVRSAKVEVEKLVEQRFAYFKKEFIDQKKPLLAKEHFSSNTALAALERALENSAIYALMQGEVSSSGLSPEAYQTSRKEQLQRQNPEVFKKLETLFAKDQLSLFTFYAQLPFYKEMAIQHGVDGDLQMLLNAANYLEQYIAFKMLGKPMDKRPKIDMHPEKIDYVPLHSFLTDFSVGPRLVDAQEGEKTDLAISDEQLLKEYGISASLGQNILFAYAKLLSYPGENELQALKSFFNEAEKGVKGIYFDGKHWVVNENNGSDDEFAFDDELNTLANIRKMQEYVQKNTDGSFLYGDMFTESSTVNKELGKQLGEIIKEHLDLRAEPQKTLSKITSYIRTNSTEEKFLSLPLELLIQGRKAGFEHLGDFLYGYKDQKIQLLPLKKERKRPF